MVRRALVLGSATALATCGGDSPTQPNDSVDAPPIVYSYDADGSGRRVLASDGVWNISPTWSPDGKWILYEHWAESTTGGCAFRRISPSGGTPITVVPATTRGVCGGASWR